MILADCENDVKKHSILTHQEYGIVSSPKMYKLLSSGLYKNKIRAVIRELSTNSFDSHVMAGCKDKPFDVHLPTLSEPYFSIRDYGVGLTHEQAKTTYCLYGASDKTHTNELNGCQGLGSKSPFCYTNTFTVISYLDGKKYIYVATFGEKPELNEMMAPVDTNEPNGLEVSVKVSQADITSFLNEASRVYKHFQVKPKCNKTIDLNTQEIESTDKWIRHTDYTFQGNSYVLMGNVMYPIDDFSLFTLDEKNILRCNLIFKVNIGDVEFDIGREGLQYTNRTVTAIKNAIKAFELDWTKKQNEKLAQFTHLWDACLYIKDLKAQMPQLTHLIKSFVCPLGNLDTIFEVNATGIAGEEFYLYCSKIRNKPLTQTLEHKFQIEIKPNSTFVINDTGKVYLTKTLCKNYATTSRNTVYLFTAISKADLAKQLHIDEAKIVLFSSLLEEYKKLPKTKRVGYGSRPSSYVFKDIHGGVVKIDTKKDKGYYLRTYQNRVELDGRYVDMDQFKKQYDRYVDLTGDKTPVILCNGLMIKKVENNPNFGLFSDLMKETLKKNEKKIQTLIDNVKLKDTKLFNTFCRLVSSKNEIKNAVLLKLVTIASEVTEYNFNYISRLYYFLAMPELRPSTKTFKDEIDGLIKDYPLLPHFSEYIPNKLLLDYLHS